MLGDGSRHRVYMRHLDPSELAAEVAAARAQHAGRGFVAVARQPACN